jgi:hypothetical protein
LKRGATFRLFFVLLTGLYACGVDAQSTVQSKRETKAAPSATTYSITGVVIDAVHGAPVAHCHLTATLNSTGRGGSGNGGFGNRQFPALNDGFDCDARSHFNVTLPSPGSWRLTASARGFVSQAYDAHPPFASAIVLTPEAPTKDLEFRISPEASIVGLVIDEAGEPVRNAQITLQNVPPPSPGGPQALGTTRGNTRTDDRGMYELPNLAPGDYRVSVHAQPWYAAGGQQIRGNDTNTPSPDPPLDFVYAATWFPGVNDPELAETIALHAGETRQADFHMVPIPSIHMRILAPPRVSSGTNPTPTFPIVQQVNSGGGPNFVQVTTRFDAQGQMDVGGLAPGVYQVRLAGPNQEAHSALVEVSANSTRTVDLSAPSRDMARIKLGFDGLADVDSSSRFDRNGGMQITLIDRDNHRGSFSFNSNEGGGINLVRRDQNTDRTLDVPPGRYEVVLQGRPNIFVTGLTAKGAEVAGRYVTVGAGESTLVVHVSSGRATVNGIATLDEKPVVGAMVLLVPITIEDPNSITFLVQDQTNTDGSFSLANVIPGQYILVAIDHGWQINWGDASTLRRYLMQGVPIDLKSSALVKQNIAAQAP